MSEKLPVTVIMNTYDRGDGSRTALARQTLVSLKQNLIYPNLHWIIVDDDSPKHEEHVKAITQDYPDIQILKTTDHAGVGNAKNIALQEAWKISPVVLLLEDDWYLPEPLDILRYVQTLLDHDDIGMIRLGYLGGDGLTSTLFSYEIFNDYWRLHRGSNVYVYSGQISLRHKRFYDVVGYHSERTTPGEEELEMCKRFNGTDRAPDILWPAEYAVRLNSSPFKNIGMGASLNSVMPGVG
jgi:glycosyltransferase involved in cell wall biosynthesis